MISAQYLEMDNIYNAIMRIGYRSVAICSANTGEGCTTVISQLAQRFLLAGHRTLVVDFNLYHPGFVSLLDFKHGQQIHCASTVMPPTNHALTVRLIRPNAQQLAFNGILAPKDTPTIIRLRTADALQQHIAAWQKDYDLVLFDTSPLSRKNSHNIPGHQVAAACEASLLIILAGKTREMDLGTAVKSLHEAKANLIGCIINDKFNPSLMDELMRQTKRLEPRFYKIGKYLRRKVSACKFLSIER